jgi:hypothetical protein
MKIKNSLLTFFLCLAPCISILHAQNSPRWQIDLQAGFFFGFINEATKNGLGVYDAALADFELNDVAQSFSVSHPSVALAVNYQIKPFLNLNLALLQAGFSYDGYVSIRSNSIESILLANTGSKFQRLNLNLKFDVLFKDDYEELNLMVGAGYNLLHNRTISNDYNDDFILLGATRTMRQLRYFNLNLGVEWRDYFTKHFGYFLQLSYNPTIRTSTHSLLFERVYLNGGTHPLEGKEINPGENANPQENFEFSFVSFNIGLTYQW